MTRLDRIYAGVSLSVVFVAAVLMLLMAACTSVPDVSCTSGGCTSTVVEHGAGHAHLGEQAHD